jgi:pimeloyl-ACP methyl ester carboxylesterase
MLGVVDATKAAFETQGGADVFAPLLPYASKLRSARAETIVLTLLKEIDQILAQRGDFERIIIIGYSFGGVIARRLFLVAAGKPPSFKCEVPFEQEGTRPWAKTVDRLVTINALNRGWQVSGQERWKESFFLNLFGFLGHLSPKKEWRPTVFDMRLGAPFIIPIRLNWLAYRRWHERLRRPPVAEGPEKMSLSPEPIIVQLNSTRDGLTSPFDQVDIAIDDPNQSTTSQDQRNFFVGLKNTNHEQAIIFSGTPDADNRRDFS